MDLLKSNHTVPFDKADKAPLSKIINQTPQYATDGDPAQSIPATIFPAYHYNSLISEIVNAIKAGGKKPSNDDWGQLASIITDIIGEIDDLNGHFKNIKEVGKDAQGVYVIYEDNGKDQKTYILTPSDLDDIKQRLSAAEGTIINHTSRLDNYGDSINRIYNDKLPAKADLNGDSSKDFNANNLNATNIQGGGIAVHGGVLRIDAYLNDDHKYVRSWGINQIPNDNNILQIIGFAKDNPDDSNNTGIFIEFYKQNPNYSNKPTVAIPQTLITPQKGDLSELYEADQLNYQPGQVMMMGGDKEITLCTKVSNVFGVYSTDPAYILNGHHTDYSIPIAMIGRVPVFVEGPLTIEDKLTPTDHGTATASRNASDIIIGRPVKADLNTEIRLVECYVKAVV